MTPQSGRKKEPVNENWKAEIASYDSACEAESQEYRRHHIVVDNSGRPELTEEENEVFQIALRGASCSDIAEMYQVEEHIITGLMEIIRAKLSLTD
jgi:DNA-binding CsgD family transcriptional regulator